MFWRSWCLTISEDGEGRFREPKTIYEVRKAIPSSTKYKNKWAVTIFGEWQISRSVKAPVLDPGGLFKNYDLHKVARLSTSIEEMHTVNLNYWLDGGGREVEGEISTKACLWNSLWYPTVSRLIISGNFWIVVDDVLIFIEKCSLKCMYLI